MENLNKIIKGAGVLLISAFLIFSTVAVTANTTEKQLSTTYSPSITGESKVTNGNQPIFGPIIWDNGGTIPGSNLYSTQLDLVYPFVSQVADDFFFEEETEVWDVHWWGGFWGGTPFDPVDFYIYFYADDGTGNAPTGGGMPDPSPTALATYFFPAVSGLPLDPNGFYEYHADLPTPFIASGGYKYWIAIQAVFAFPPQWGWANTGGILLSPAVQGFPLLAVPFWTLIDPPVDMAFYLTGEGEEPVPLICCEGDIEWTDVEPGTQVTATFEICYCGEPDSLLDWSICGEPEWGTDWEFDPASGTDLPEGDCVEVEVTVTAPDEGDETFEGEIEACNSDNPDDSCTVDVKLVTPFDLVRQRNLFLEQILYFLI